MARSDTVTWLSLDRWFAILGIHPFHANGLVSAKFAPGTNCGLIWFQFAWQNADRISREDIGIAIREAELAIAGEVGYNLLPDWTPLENGQPERLNFTRPALRELYNRNGLNVRGQRVSVQLLNGHIISGGVRLKAGIETAAVVRSDADGDGYDELVTVIVATNVTDVDEIKVYYPGENGDDVWEIRPINVVLDGVNATITFNSWQIVDPDAQQSISLDAPTIDADLAASYLTTVDVYRVRNDPQTQVQFLWEGDPFVCGCGSDTCNTCQFGTQLGCFLSRDERLGIIVPAPGTWDADDSQFDPAAFAICRAPDQARVHYYSGWRDPRGKRPKSDMDPFWETAVAYLAAGYLDKDGCDCSNAMEFIKKWRRDLSFLSEGQGAFNITASQLAMRLGSTRGALYATKKMQQSGRRLGGR